MVVGEQSASLAWGVSTVGRDTTGLDSRPAQHRPSRPSVQHRVIVQPGASFPAAIPPQ